MKRDLENFEVVRKMNSVTECSGRETVLQQARYINYGCLGLMTLTCPLVENDLIRTAGIFSALKYAVNKYMKIKYLNNTNACSWMNTHNPQGLHRCKDCAIIIISIWGLSTILRK